ncbi:DUF6348 family protein [Nonomuraea maritima]|uniref:DUF6348 family protein n=1 Tax=Nonomuraea maritima TaxID=683260 RepID=UPI00371D5C99
MEGQRLADDTVLGLVAAHLSAAMGRPWEVRDGMAKGPGSLAVLLGPDRTGREDHLDLHFVLDVERPDETTITDRTAGYGDTAEQAAERAVRTWLDTTAAALLELLLQDGTRAAHLAPDDPDGFPGRHAVHGGIAGWGTGDDHDAVQRWAVRHALLPYLAPALKGAVGHEPLVGLKAFFGGGESGEVAEVRVGGVHHAGASRALAALDWPRPGAGVSYARTFVLLVRPDDAGPPDSPSC